jgi:glycolate oxidase iron-sulfur subunit
VALIQGLLSGELDDSARLGTHLGNCLECLACEPVCPSLVRFGVLMDGVRAQRVAQLPRWHRLWLRLPLDLLADWRMPALLALISAVYRRSGLSFALKRLGLLSRGRLAVLDGLAGQLRRPRDIRTNALPAISSGHATATQGDASTTDGVGLFLGCVSRGLQAPTAQAALLVLKHLGIPVNLPSRQGCCGAMHRHNGYPEDADRLLAQNQEAFGSDRVVGFASACVAELQQGLDAREICRFLIDTPWPTRLTLRPLPALVAVHEPCSHRNLLRDTQAVYALLARIPELRVVGLDGNDSCCGAAGTYLLDHPETALTLATDKVRHVTDLDPRYLVTTNTGCAAHLAARLRAAGSRVEVLHPVELIARQIAEGPSA